MAFPSKYRIITLSMVFALTHIICANAHGMICSPRQRGAFTSFKCGNDLPFPENPVIDHCAHCLNGGGIATIRQNLPLSGWHQYNPIENFNASATRAGLCGDAKQSKSHMIGGEFMPYSRVPIVAHWKSGAVIDLQAEIDTNHNGFFEFFLCNLDSCNTTDIAPKCFRNGHCHKLRRVAHDECERRDINTDFECGPIDQKHPGRWYLPCRRAPTATIHNTLGGTSGTMRYKLPALLRCKHCVLQWYWVTANACAPADFLGYFKTHRNPFGTRCAGDGGAIGGHRDGMMLCGGQTVPEEFWSCADVQITHDGNSIGDVKAIEEASRDVARDGKRAGHEEEGVKKNKTKLLVQEEEKLKGDLYLTADQSTVEKKGKEDEAKKGYCLDEFARCDGSVRCCDTQQVCVFLESSSGFSCRFWWSLYTEAEDRKKKERYTG